MFIHYLEQIIVIVLIVLLSNYDELPSFRQHQILIGQKSADKAVLRLNANQFIHGPVGISFIRWKGSTNARIAV